MRTAIHAIALALLFAAAAHAAEPARIPLTLADAIERAHTSSQRLAQLHALENAAEENIRIASAAKMPQAALTAGYTHTSNVPEFSIALPGIGLRTLFPNITENYRGALSASVPLYTGGRIQESIRAAEHQRSASALDSSAAANDLTLETTIAFWSLVTAQDSVKVLEQSLVTFDAHLKDARNRKDLGLAAANEVLAVEVERDRAEVSLLRARNSAELANANLLRLIGSPPGSIVEPAEPLTAIVPQDDGNEKLVVLALERRPERAALLARIKASEANVGIQRSAVKPQSSFVADYVYANPNSRIFPLSESWRSSWDVGFTLSLTLFDAGRTKAAAAQATAQTEALRRQLDDLDERIRLEVTSRRLDLATAEASVNLSDRSVESAKENARVAADRYREGVAPSSELLDAETALLRAELDQTESRAQLRLAKAALDRAVGR
ncbi:MAG TPA: TolC family protein [Thermoanaerobaculia bacterium]|nr:TolC family protein [Thermoanaerobaculia bacterium]